MGIARIVGAITFSIVIGLLMSFIFRKEEKAKKEEQMNITPPPEKRPMWQTSFHFFTMVLILVFANWGAPAVSDKGLWLYIFTYKWYITGILALFFCWSLIWVLKLPVTWVLLGAIATTLSAFLANTFITDAKLVPLLPMIIGITSLSVILLFDKRDDENREWAFSSWGFAKQILPLLAIGVVFAGFLLGSTHDDITIAGIIPNHWIEWAVGGNSLLSNFFASFTGAFMYFATLTEVPIIQGLLASGMGKGPALALLRQSCMLPSLLSWQPYQVISLARSVKTCNLQLAVSEKKRGLKTDPAPAKKYKTQHLFPMLVAHEDLHGFVLRHSQLVVQVGRITVTVFSPLPKLARIISRVSRSVIL